MYISYVYTDIIVVRVKNCDTGLPSECHIAYPKKGQFLWNWRSRMNTGYRSFIYFALMEIPSLGCLDLVPLLILSKTEFPTPLHTENIALL